MCRNSAQGDCSFAISNNEITQDMITAATLKNDSESIFSKGMTLLTGGNRLEGSYYIRRAAMMGHRKAKLVAWFYLQTTSVCTFFPEIQ